MVGCGQRKLIAADSEAINVAHELVPLAVVFYQVTPHRLAVVGKDIGLITIELTVHCLFHIPFAVFQRRCWRRVVIVTTTAGTKRKYCYEKAC